MNWAFVEVCKADTTVLHAVQQEGYYMYDGVQGSCACTVKPAIVQRDMQPCTSCSTSAGTDRLHLVLDNRWLDCAGAAPVNTHVHIGPALFYHMQHVGFAMHVPSGVLV